jgi:hypothetical protein
MLYPVLFQISGPNHYDKFAAHFWIYHNDKFAASSPE